MGLKLKPNYVAANDDFNQWKSDMVGNCKLHVGGGGGGGEFAVYTGYEYSKEDVTIDKQIDSITVKASLSFKYGPISGGTDVTGVTAREQTRQTTERTARSEKTETRWTCPPKEGYLLHLYQWELSGQFAVPELLNSPDSTDKYTDTVAYDSLFQCV
jgi:hypothetical protein